MAYALFVSLAVAILAVLLAKLVRVALFSAASKLPRATSTVFPWLPFGIGAALEFNKNPIRFLQGQRRRLGDTFRVNFGVFEWIFVFGIKAQTLFFRSHDDVLNFHEGVEELIGDAGADVHDKEWDRTVNQFITKGFMKRERQAIFAGIVSEVVDPIIWRWPQATSIDLFKELSSVVLRVAIRAMVGNRVYSKHADKLIPLYQRFEADMVDPLGKIFPQWVPLPSRSRNKRMYKYIDEIVMEEVKLRFEEMKHGKQMPDDYLQLLIKETGTRFVHMFGAHLMMIIMAAHTNTAGTSAWTLAQIYSNRDLLGRVRKEIVDTIGDVRGPAACQAAVAARLPLLDACMRETGRLYSGVVFVRKCKSAFEVEGGAVPAGCLVVTYPRVTTDDIHIDSDKYIPDRWVPGTAAYVGEDEMRPSSSQVVHPQFGAGRHPCLGERFAVTVMTAVWVSLIQELELEFVDAKTGIRAPVPAKGFTEAHLPAFLSTLGTPWPCEPLFIRATRRGELTEAA